MTAIVDEEWVDRQSQELQQSEVKSPQFRVLPTTRCLDLEKPNGDINSDSDGPRSLFQVRSGHIGQRHPLSYPYGIDEPGFDQFQFLTLVGASHLLA